MSEIQQVQMTMAKTPEQIAAEARAAARLVHQREIAREIFVNEQAEQDDPNSNRHRNDYTRTVTVRDQVWVCTWDSTSRHYITRDDQPDDRVMSISHRVMLDDQDNGDCLEDNYCCLNVTELFAGKRQNIASMIMSLIKANDADAKFTLSVIMKHGEYDIKWPESDATANALSMADMFILMSQAKEAGTILHDRESNHIGKVMSVEYRPAGAFNPEYIRWSTSASLSQGGKLIQAMMPGYTASQKLFGADLPIYPATAEQIEAAVKKGRAMHELLSGTEGFAHLSYAGIGYTPGWFGSRVPHSVDTRVVVDPEGLRLMNQSMLDKLVDLIGVSIKQNDNYEAVTITEVADSDYASVVQMAVFYNLAKGNWMLGHVENLTQIQYREDAFDRLVLDSQRKRLVEALVVHNGAIREGTPDIIDGKGGGCIFLLDGPPGTGKTLTAEATAEKLERVLYKVGLGELGVDASSMESRLSQILSTAARWNAVLLLDEADVFLEKRSTENLQRNAMVAVFLRLLEYYNGILFLTTNRGDNFDQAVISRVTLALHFRAQDEAGRKTIWKNLLLNAGIKVSDTELSHLSNLAVNGREIKNAINSSRALAASDGTGVTYQHLREIIDASTLFATEVAEAKR